MTTGEYMGAKHLGNVVRKQRVDGAQVLRREVEEAAAALLRHLHRRAAQVVRVPERHACRQDTRSEYQPYTLPVLCTLMSRM